MKQVKPIYRLPMIKISGQIWAICIRHDIPQNPRLTDITDLLSVTLPWRLRKNCLCRLVPTPQCITEEVTTGRSCVTSLTCVWNVNRKNVLTVWDLVFSQCWKVSVGLLYGNTMWTCRQIPMFQRGILSSSSRLNCCTEDGDSMFLWNAGICLQVYMVWLLLRTPISTRY
jgi:hypothetical protein